MNSLVLGIDAAWTTTQPSGIALVAVDPDGILVLRQIGRSSMEFVSCRQIGFNDWLTAPPATERILEISEILRATKICIGGQPDVVALDIPLSPVFIKGRRSADNEISRRYGTQWATTHTPSAERPGLVSATLFQQLSESGYEWVNTTKHAHPCRHRRYFLETYPHPVIVEMLRLDRRLPYKVAKRRTYWPDSKPNERWWNIASELDCLRDALASRINGVEERIPMASSLLDHAPKSRGAVLKGIEDALDAVVCAFVGCEFLKAHAIPFGDRESTIWIPINRQRKPTAQITRRERLKC